MKKTPIKESKFMKVTPIKNQSKELFTKPNIFLSSCVGGMA